MPLAKYSVHVSSLAAKGTYHTASCPCVRSTGILLLIVWSCICTAYRLRNKPTLQPICVIRIGLSPVLTTRNVAYSGYGSVLPGPTMILCPTETWADGLADRFAM